MPLYLIASLIPLAFLLGWLANDLWWKNRTAARLWEWHCQKTAKEIMRVGQKRRQRKGE